MAFCVSRSAGRIFVFIAHTLAGCNDCFYLFSWQSLIVWFFRQLLQIQMSFLRDLPSCISSGREIDCVLKDMHRAIAFIIRFNGLAHCFVLRSFSWNALLVGTRTGEGGLSFWEQGRRQHREGGRIAWLYLGCKQHLKHQQDHFRGCLTHYWTALMQPPPHWRQEELLTGLGRNQGCSWVDGASLGRCHLNTSGSHFLHCLPGAVLPPSPSSFQPLHGRSVSARTKAPPGSLYLGVSSVVQPGICVAKQPISRRWVSMVMEQKHGGE